MAALMPTLSSDMLQMLSRMERMLGTSSTSEDEGTLAVDIYEEDDALIVEASVPGFRREDLVIQLHEGLLSIVANRPAETLDTGRHYYRRERPVGSWTRRIALPGIVHEATVDAELKSGVLTLRIPVPASAKPRQIEIRTDEARLSVESGADTWNGGEDHVAPEPATAARN